MPRPLIIKVQEHKTKSQGKATGSINFQLLKEPGNSWYESFNQDTYYEPVDNEQAMEDTGSMVRNLINRYESSTPKPALIKYKSKSMPDLAKPQLSLPKKKTQDDLLNNRNNSGESDDHAFDFRKILSKFETPNQLTQKADAPATKSKIKTYKPIDVDNYPEDFKVKAKELLDNFQHSSSTPSALTLWQDEVVEFLRKLSSLSYEVSSKTNAGEVNGYKVEKKEETSTEYNVYKRAKSLDAGEFSKSPKVKDMQNVFDANAGGPKPISRSISSVYFTGKATDNITFYEQSFKEPIPQLSVHNVQNEDIPVLLASTKKIQELRNIFESDAVDNKYVPYDFAVQNGNSSAMGDAFEDVSLHNNGEEERIIPPPKVITLDENEDDEEDIEGSKEQIEKLVQVIEDYENKIENISEEDQEEGGYINDMLIRILISLDETKTYGDMALQKARREAIYDVQNCIKKLRAKIET